MSGGPRLRWILPVINPEPRPTLVSGTIGFLKSYRNPETGSWDPPSDELKAAFKAVTATLRQHMVPLPVAKDRKIWIGLEAKRQLDAGKVFLDL